MRLFKKKEKPAADEGSAGKLWKQLDRWLDRHHKNWAVFMRRQSERLPLWARWSVLIAFTGGSMCLCFYTAVSAFYAGQVTVRPAVIKINRYSLSDGTERLRGKTIVSENEYKKIAWFKRYLDSMSATAQGRRLADSLLAGRPGLYDSITAVENIYLSQSKK